MRLSWFTAALALLCGSCASQPSPVSGGDPSRGPAAIARYGCGTCHTISSLNNAHGLVGPPLTGVADRLYIAGMLQNTPVNLEHWIRDPKSVNARTAMPNLGVSSQDSIDIAAYLYSLRKD